MKKSFLLSIALVLIGLMSFAQWELLPSGTTKSLHSVYFTDANTGYSVGDNGKILKTINGGLAWDSLTGGTYNLNSVYFPNANTGYAVGDSGTILKTINGGLTWDSLTSGTAYSLSSVYFIDADTGYAVGGYWYSYWDYCEGVIIKTIDGGMTWNIQYSGGTYLSSISFTDANTGYAVGFTVINLAFGKQPYGRIFKTPDGGRTWNLQYQSPYGNNFNSVNFPEENTGYTVGNYFGFGTILKTSDEGITWESQSSPSSPGLNSVFFTNSDSGIAVGGGGTILRTYDAGTTWSAQQSGISDDLFSVFFNNIDTGYAVGNNGVILKTTNGGGPPVEIDEKTQTTSLKIYPNPAKEKIIIEPTESGNYMNGTVSIYGMTGQELIRQQASKGELNVNSLPSGIYFVRLIKRGKIEFGKFVKN
jgi:photosystem II stability/assembly factor-like uncharacterized protein